MKTALPRPDSRPVLSAAEIGEFAYCAKAWYLKRCGETAQGEQLAAGVGFHQQHAARVARASRLQRAGARLALLALVLLIVLMLGWLLTAGPR